MLLKTNAYLKSYGVQSKWIYFLTEYYNLLNKYNTIWGQISCDTKKELHSEPVYNKKFLKTKKNFYGDEYKDFHDKEVPKQNLFSSDITLFYSEKGWKLLSVCVFKRIK